MQAELRFRTQRAGSLSPGLKVTGCRCNTWTSCGGFIHRCWVATGLRSGRCSGSRSEKEPGGGHAQQFVSRNDPLMGAGGVGAKGIEYISPTERRRKAVHGGCSSERARTGSSLVTRSQRPLWKGRCSPVPTSSRVRALASGCGAARFGRARVPRRLEAAGKTSSNVGF